MDSDDEISPDAKIFDNRIDDICKESMEIYNRKFIFRCDDDDDEDDEIEELQQLEKKEEKKEQKTTIQTRKSPRKDIKSTEEIKEDDKDSVLGSEARELLREIAAKRQARTRGRKGGKRKNAISTDTGDFIEGIKLTASAKKRIRNIELETARDMRRIEEESKMVFAKCDSFRKSYAPEVSETVEDTDLEIYIKIRYRGKVTKLNAREKEEFKFIFQRVAFSFGMKPTGFLLCLGDNNIKLSDTPESLKIGICDIIDCIPYDEDEDTLSNSNKLLLKLQSNDTRKKTEIRAHKLEQFLEVMKKYADMRQLPLESLTFEFDGELIRPDETPLDLDMESGSCIDVRVSKAKPSPRKAPTTDAKNIPPIPMMNIIEID